MLCASSFLLPFVWPNHLDKFYWGLSVAAILSLIPTRFDRLHCGNSMLLILIVMSNLRLMPISTRFPVLSVWIDKPRFAINEDQKNRGISKLEHEISLEKFEAMLTQEFSICCVAPVIAPPGIRERITQEWTIDKHVIERPKLSKLIQGNEEQRGFHSFFCKHNFPEIKSQSTIRCQISLQESIYLGEIQLSITD
jgi:hypothetical protein